MLNLFGVRHGKRPCNACAGRVKQTVLNLVKTETLVINSAIDFYNACKDHLETMITEGPYTHYLHTFEFTNHLNSRPNTSKWMTVPDTHKIHSVANVVGTSQINIKNFLCCCGGCIHGGMECQNQICPQPWKGFDLRLKKMPLPISQTRWFA